MKILILTCTERQMQKKSTTETALMYIKYILCKEHINCIIFNCKTNKFNHPNCNVSCNIANLIIQNFKEIFKDTYIASNCGLAPTVVIIIYSHIPNNHTHEHHY